MVEQRRLRIYSSFTASGSHVQESSSLTMGGDEVLAAQSLVLDKIAHVGLVSPPRDSPNISPDPGFRINSEQPHESESTVPERDISAIFLVRLMVTVVVRGAGLAVLVVNQTANRATRHPRVSHNPAYTTRASTEKQRKKRNTAYQLKLVLVKQLGSLGRAEGRIDLRQVLMQMARRSISRVLRSAFDACKVARSQTFS
jgi:hypothetical protein